MEPQSVPSATRTAVGLVVTLTGTSLILVCLSTVASLSVYGAALKAMGPMAYLILASVVYIAFIPYLIVSHRYFTKPATRSSGTVAMAFISFQPFLIIFFGPCMLGSASACFLINRLIFKNMIY
jgi:hypothetical protein